MLSNGYYLANSLTTRSMQILRYFKFVEEFKGLLVPTPCPTSQMALYIAWLARSLSYGSITNYLSALNFFLCSEGKPLIDYASHTIRIVLGGAKRKFGCAVQRSAHVLPKEFTQIFSFMSSNLGHTCTHTAPLIGFRALLRKCQLTYSDSVLRRKDFEFLHCTSV